MVGIGASCDRMPLLHDDGRAWGALAAQRVEDEMPGEERDVVDPREFRTAAGQFLTGVTVITTVGADGVASGLTANSFTSVSLHPPMLLFCLGRDSTNLEAFEAGNGFVVHVLSAAQQDIAQRFATKGIDRFESVDWSPGRHNLPVIRGSLATFECDQVHTYDGGDHLILVGEVKAMSVGDSDREALGFFRGRYVVSPPPA